MTANQDEKIDDNTTTAVPLRQLSRVPCPRPHQKGGGAAAAAAAASATAPVAATPATTEVPATTTVAETQEESVPVTVTGKRVAPSPEGEVDGCCCSCVHWKRLAQKCLLRPLLPKLFLRLPRPRQ